MRSAVVITLIFTLAMSFSGAVGAAQTHTGDGDAALRTERFRLYRVERIAAENAPEIDGRVDETVWDGKARLTALRNFLGERKGEFPSQRSEFTIITDGRYIYIGARFFEESMDTIRRSPANQPFWNDCIELYFDPNHEGTRLIQLVVDCPGRRFWKKKFNEGYGWWEDKAWYMLANWSAAARMQRASWSVEIRIEADSFGIDTSKGSVSGFNACRFRLGGEVDEFSAWTSGPDNKQKDMDGWGHLLFLPIGASGKKGRISRSEVGTVYPSLKGRRLMLPIDDGFRVFTEASVDTVTFEHLLEGKIAALRKAATGAERQLAALAADDRRAAKLRNEFAKAEDTMQQLLDDADKCELSLGTYERLQERVSETTVKLNDIRWRAKIVQLALAEVKETG